SLSRAAAAFDGPHPAGLSRPAVGIHLGGVMPAGVHTGGHHVHHLAIRPSVPPKDHIVQGCPGLHLPGVAHDDAVLDAPALLLGAPAHDLILQAVVLDVHRGSEHQYGGRHLTIVHLTPA